MGIELNAFGKEEDNLEETVSGNDVSERSVTNDIQINIDEAKSVKDGSKSVVNHTSNENSDKLMPNPNSELLANPKTAQRHISASARRSKRIRHTESTISPQQINAIKVMFVKLESKVEEINTRLKEREYYDQLVTNTVDTHLQGATGGGKSGGLIQAEFIGLKHLVGRHQVSISK